MMPCSPVTPEQGRLAKGPCRALFVTNRQHIGDAVGGVQTCTRDYLDLHEACGFEVAILKVDVDRRLLTRIQRQLRTSPYCGSVSRPDQQRLEEAAQTADLIFLNQVALANQAAPLKAKLGRAVPVILLSHGAEITDLLHLVRLQPNLPLSGRLRPTPELALPNVLTDEISARQGIDAALCLSEFDASYEHWLGVKRVAMIPRGVTADPLDRQPIFTRFGYLGTLDHAPNLEGLVEILRVLDHYNCSDLNIRIVGGPPRLGEWLSERFRAATYLGPIPDEPLRAEACSWSGFLNPIFCQARGCSTKLARAFAWQIPIVTTPVGRRGYVFDQGSIVEAQTPVQFVAAMQDLSSRERNAQVQRELQLAALSMPRIQHHVSILHHLIISLSSRLPRSLHEAA